MRILLKSPTPRATCAFVTIFAFLAACSGSEEVPDAGFKLKNRDAQTSTEKDAGPSADDGGFDAGPTSMDAMVMVMDQDQDGIEDAFDPEPRRKNELLFSDDFDEIRPDWSFSSLSMSIDTQMGVLSVPKLEPFEREGWIGPRPAWTDYIIQSRFRVTSVGNSDRVESGHAGLIMRVRQISPSRYITCGLDLKRNKAVLAEHEGGRVTELESTDSQIAVGEWVTLTLQLRNDYFACFVNEVKLDGRSTLSITGSVGFRSYDATFEADWLRVYDRFP